MQHAAIKKFIYLGRATCQIVTFDIQYDLREPRVSIAVRLFIQQI